jgi:hypothetical protein
VTVNGGVAVGPAGQQIKWFAQSQATPIDIQVTIQDNGSGVQPSSLTLVVGATRIDAGTPTCTGSNPTLTCHFSVTPSSVPTSVVPTGDQRQLQFSVAGTDVAGNAVKTNQAAVGIDGKPPTIAFTVGAGSGFTTSYPVAFADCNGGAADGTMYCGHDGSHFWRAGDGKYNVVFTVSDTFTAPNDVGSGASTSGSTCSIAGSATACTVTFNASNNTFTFPADFATATFTSAADGTGTVSVTVNAKDAVGNVAAPVTVPDVKVTRVKWMRQVNLPAISGSPILSTSLGLLIVGGNVSAGSDAIFGLRAADGLPVWGTGGTKPAGVPAPPISSITGNMALDATPSTDQTHPTPILYVNSGNSLFALHLGADKIDQYCSSRVSLTANPVGSPLIFGAGAAATVVSAAGGTVAAFTTTLSASGGGCFPISTFTFVNTAPAGTQPALGPPSANGSAVYFPYDNSANTASDLGIRSIQFSAGAFSSPAGNNLGQQPSAGSNAAAISAAGDLFFGVDADRKFYRYGADLTTFKWATTAVPLMVGQPLVSGSQTFGSTNILNVYNTSDGNLAWSFGTSLTQVSPPTIANGSIFVSNARNKEMVAVDSTSHSARWTYSGSAATIPSTALASVATEATLATDGTLYFGDAAGHVFALISDSSPLTSGAADWPRTGYDNCNSNHAGNSGFVCQ